MSNIDEIKKLRDITGLSIGKCKEALSESGGDMGKAQEILREKGTITAQKKADRALGSGVIECYVHNNRIGAMVELLCETDFVAKNDEFLTLAKDIAIHCAAFNPLYISRESVPEEDIEKITNELMEEMDESKPKDMQEKILEGQIDSRFKSSILLKQPFVKDDSMNIQTLIDGAVQKFGERIEVSRIKVWSI